MCVCVCVNITTYEYNNITPNKQRKQQHDTLRLIKILIK